MQAVTPAELRKYISAKEAAELLGVSPNTVRDWARGRLVRSALVGAVSVRVHLDDLMLMVKLRDKR